MAFAAYNIPRINAGIPNQLTNNKNKVMKKPYKVIHGTVNAFSYIDDTWLAPYCGWDVTVYRYRGYVDIEFRSNSEGKMMQTGVVSDTWKKCITPTK